MCIRDRFGTLYTDYELCHYVGKHVGIKWDIDDVTKLYVFDEEGRKICEAVSAELLAFGPHCSQAALERHLRDQKRQEKEMREILEDMRRPYELRVQEGGRPSSAVGTVSYTHLSLASGGRRRNMARKSASSWDKGTPSQVGGLEGSGGNSKRRPASISK